MKINSVKIISLLFFVLSAFYLYTAHQIQVFAFDEGAAFNAKTFPIYLGYAGMFFAGLKIVFLKSRYAGSTSMGLVSGKAIFNPAKNIPA